MNGPKQPDNPNEIANPERAVWKISEYKKHGWPNMPEDGRKSKWIERKILLECSQASLGDENDSYENETPTDTETIPEATITILLHPQQECIRKRLFGDGGMTGISK